MLALIGIPGIYFHSLFGSRGWRAGVDLTGRNRTINRQKFEAAAFENELTDESSLRYHVFNRYAQCLKARRASPAFHPHGEQQVLDCGEAVFALLRLSRDGSQRVLCLHNISSQLQNVKVDLKGILDLSSSQGTDLITGDLINTDSDGILVLKPYQTLWLRSKE